MRRHLLAGTVGVLLAASWGGATARPQDQERSTNMSDGSGTPSDGRIVLQVGDTEVAVTLADARAIRTALRSYLEASDYPERDEVLVWTRAEAEIEDGAVRIGPWLLGSERGEIVLRYREAATGLAMKAHRAVVEKKDGVWTVTKVEMERIRPRR